MSLDNLIKKAHPTKRYNTYSAVSAPDSTIACKILQSFDWLLDGNGKLIFFNLHIPHAPRLRVFHLLLVVEGGELETVCVGVDASAVPSSMSLRNGKENGAWLQS